MYSVKSRLNPSIALLATVVACSPASSPGDAAAKLLRAEVDRRADDRCDMVEREGGPCILWSPSLVELIARPELFDGRRVRVIGFANFEFEGNGLYLSREDWRQNIFRNGIWIDPPKGYERGSAPSPNRLNREYVIVEATFHGGRGGHFGMWSGTLDSVTRLDRWGYDSAGLSAPKRLR